MAKNALWKIAVPLTFTLKRKIIAVYFLQLFTYTATGFEIWPFEVEIPVGAIFPMNL